MTMENNTQIVKEKFSFYNQPKVYTMVGIDTAMHLLRPGAKWEIYNNEFSRWDDERPRPSWQEILDTVEKIKQFEDSFDTIWTKNQLEKLTGVDFTD